jgi:hypothetical protein
VVLTQDSAKASALQAEVESLLDKGVIVHIDNPGPGFYSHIFVVPKKPKGSWRLIIDLSRLNRFLRVPHFKMETTRSIAAAAMLPGDWAAPLDLQDAYLHVPVHPDYQRYLRFYFEDRAYQFKAMPFGLASAPLIFQSIVKAFVAPLHALGLKLHFYLDDWPLRNASKDILKTQMKLLIKNVKLAGWIMNEEKSELTPSQDFIFIGIRFCTRVGLMFPPPDRIVKILSAQKFCQARDFLSLIGLLNSAADQVPHGRLYLRPLQLLLLSRWRPHRDPLDRGNSPSRIPTKRRLEILGLRNSSQSGGVVSFPPPQLSMFTDTANIGLGAHVNEVDLSTKDTWSQEESNMSINILELNAVLLGVKHFRTQLKNQRVSLFLDNSTVVAYIFENREVPTPQFFAE